MFWAVGLQLADAFLKLNKDTLNKDSLKEDGRFRSTGVDEGSTFEGLSSETHPITPSRPFHQRERRNRVHRKL